MILHCTHEIEPKYDNNRITESGKTCCIHQGVYVVMFVIVSTFQHCTILSLLHVCMFVCLSHLPKKSETKLLLQLLQRYAVAVAESAAAVTVVNNKKCLILFQCYGKIDYIRLHICTEQLRR